MVLKGILTMFDCIIFKTTLCSDLQISSLASFKSLEGCLFGMCFLVYFKPCFHFCFKCNIWLCFFKDFFLMYSYCKGFECASENHETTKLLLPLLLDLSGRPVPHKPPSLSRILHVVNTTTTFSLVRGEKCSSFLLFRIMNYFFCFVNISFNSCTAIYVNQKTPDNKKHEWCCEMLFQIRCSEPEQSIIFRHALRFSFLLTLLELFMCSKCNDRY